MDWKSRGPGTLLLLLEWLLLLLLFCSDIFLASLREDGFGKSETDLGLAKKTTSLL
jgi:hypothetical protein